MQKVGGIWMPASVDMVGSFLTKKEREGIIALEGYYEHPEIGQYLLAFHRESIPKKPRVPLSRRLLIKKGEQAPLRVPDKLIIPSREQERITRLVTEMAIDVKNRTGLVKDTTIDFLQDPHTKIVFAIIRMKLPKRKLYTQN